MILRKILLLFFIAIHNNVFAQEITFLDDSLLTQIATTKDQRIKVDCLNRLAIIVLDGDDRLRSIKYLSEADSISRRLNYPAGIAYGAFYRGMVSWQEGDLAKAERFMINSIDSLALEGETLDLYTPLSAIRLFYNETGQHEKKLRFYQSRLAEYNQNKLQKNIGSCYHGLGNYYNIYGYNEKAIEYYTKAMESWEAQGNVICATAMRVVVAQSYFNWGNEKSAIKHLNYFKDGRTQIMPSVVYIIYLRRMAAIDISKGNYQTALDRYLRLNMYRERLSNTNIAINFVNIAMINILLNNADSAKYYLTLVEPYLENNNYTVWNANGDLEYEFCLAKYFLLTGDVKSGYKKMQDALTTVKKEKHNKLTLKYLKELSDLSQKLGEYDRAINYLQEHNKLYTSLEKESQANRFTHYETESKEQAIALLNKDNLIKQSEIRRQKLLRNGFFGGFAIVLLFAGVFLSQRNKIKEEKKRSDELLLNILPAEVAEELKLKGSADAQHFSEVTVLFTDFKNFTQLSEKLNAQELVNEINYCYSNFDRIITGYGIEKIKTIGDSYMCAGGLPAANSTNPIDVTKAALDIRDFMVAEKIKREQKGETYFEIRIGLHTGPVVAGIVGIKKFAYDIWGDTVNIASRMESSGEVGKVNVSGSTYEKIKEQFHCEHRGRIEAKNKGAIDMFFVDRIES